MLSAFFDRTQQQQQQPQPQQQQQQQQQQPQQLQGQRAVKAALRTFRAFKNILSASLLPVLGLPSFICDRIHYLRPYGCAADPFVAVLAAWWICHVWLGWYSNHWFVVFDVRFLLVVD